MQHDTQAFRTRYRAAIHPLYNAWLHGGFVLFYGLACLFFLGRQLQHVQVWEWLSVPLALLVFSWGEYTVHRHFGHHKHKNPVAALFYKRHSGDHHSFFVEGCMHYENARDWRVILFPAWLIVLFSLGLAPVWYALDLFNRNIASLFTATLLAGYLLYEILHACEHLPDDNAVARLPWIRQMRRHHARHHRRDLMQTHNFNLVIPLMDWVFNTRYQPDENDKP